MNLIGFGLLNSIVHSVLEKLRDEGWGEELDKDHGHLLMQLRGHTQIRLARKLTARGEHILQVLQAFYLVRCASKRG